MLGSGAFGNVKKVKKYGISCAVKTCEFGSSEDDIGQVMACLREEAMTLTHPYIIETLWTRWLPNKFQKAMEIGCPVTKAPPARIFHDIGQALCFLHSHGYIHRDVKPENIVRVGNFYKLIDFGLCRKGDCDSAITGYTITRWFRPPELFSSGDDTRKYDGRVDMFSLGVTAWWLQHGEPLFSGSEEEILSQYRQFKPTGTYAMLICDYEKRLSSKQFLEHFGLKPEIGGVGPYIQREGKVQEFVDLMCQGELERAYASCGGNLRSVYDRL